MRLYLFLLCFALPFISVAQRIVTGKVLDIFTNNPVDAVAVTIYKGTSTTVTNEKGYFQLHVNNDDSLLLSHRDYQIGLIGIPETDVFTVFMTSNEFFPEYQEGIASLYTFLYQNLKYPRQAMTKGIEGVLFIEALVDSIGNLKECNALNELGGHCSEEAIEVFMEIPGKWTPSHRTSRFVFPLIFSIHTNEDDIVLPAIDFPKCKFMPKISVSPPEAY